MPENIQTALWQHTLDVADLYSKNSHLKNGLPDKPPRVVIGGIEPAPPAAVAAAPLPVAASSKAGWLVKAAGVGLMAIAGTGLGGLAVSALVNGLARPDAASGGTAVVAPAAPADRDGSLLQFLQDQGQHVPPEKRGHR